jgi:hypothetical protein
MFVTKLTDSFHGNIELFISPSIEEVKSHLIIRLGNWDCDYTENEITSIIANKKGSANSIDVEIFQIEFGEPFGWRGF